MIEEQWATIKEFPRYEISDQGRVFNTLGRHEMSVSYTNHGHAKITLCDDYGQRFTRSVGMLVADAFVEAPSLLCDQLIVLDGDLTNIRASNLAWRPRGFAWQYAHQLKKQHPIYYHNLRVRNVVTYEDYKNIIEAGMTEGLLFDDIWRSTYTGARIFPHGSVFVVSERV